MIITNQFLSQLVVSGRIFRKMRPSVLIIYAKSVEANKPIFSKHLSKLSLYLSWLQCILFFFFFQGLSSLISLDSNMLWYLEFLWQCISNLLCLCYRQKHHKSVLFLSISTIIHKDFPVL